MNEYNWYGHICDGISNDTSNNPPFVLKANVGISRRFDGMLSWNVMERHGRVIWNYQVTQGRSLVQGMF